MVTAKKMLKYMAAGNYGQGISMDGDEKVRDEVAGKKSTRLPPKLPMRFLGEEGKVGRKTSDVEVRNWGTGSGGPRESMRRRG